jgi:uncharacterized protein YbcC (UPF0753/DUF2309 family)
MHNIKITPLSQEAWSIISPVWPLENFIATNPLAGFESLNFHQAIEENQQYQLFSDAIKENLSGLNQHTIKWCQAFFDKGQASLFMPNREQGFYHAWKSLAVFDKKLHQNDKKKRDYLENLPDSADDAILLSLQFMGIHEANYLTVLKLLLMTLRGWAGYVKYQAEWHPEKNSLFTLDYLAIRLVLCALLCTNVKHWPAIYKTKKPSLNAIDQTMNSINQHENHFRKNLLYALETSLKQHPKERAIKKDVQCIFCIDVRSEPFRKALEQQGHYETFGFAGFFAAPVAIKQYDKQKLENACPVLLSPSDNITECACSVEDEKNDQRRKGYLQQLKNLYFSLKYNVATPCGLAETMGPWMGLWMGVQTFFPLISQHIKKEFSRRFRPAIKTALILDNINLETKIAWSETLLNMLNLSNRLAPIVILCGHGSTTVNNAYASALDCGACGANKGGYNAYLMALILNEKEVRRALSHRGIIIPEETYFIAAEHNTTTDDVVFFNLDEVPLSEQRITQVKTHFLAAKKINTAWRHQHLSSSSKYHDAILEKRSADWAQTRPEWGLARNAAFIVAPRELTQSIHLEGKAFLHSYDWAEDPKGEYLHTIMTAPMIVAQWINHQYLFSTLDNNAYGSGSKVTHNITGKIGVMQGNASDLMSGLSLQSVYKSDNDGYHEPQRLMVIIYAPKDRIEVIIQKNKQLQHLFFNHWIALYAIEPLDKSFYKFNSETQSSIFWRKCHD